MKYLWLLILLAACAQVPAQTSDCDPPVGNAIMANAPVGHTLLVSFLNATVNQKQVANCKAQQAAAIAQQQQEAAARQQAQAQAAAQAAQQQQQAGEAEAQAVKDAEANPSPALLEFETDMGNDNSVMQIANAAFDCHLRTNMWLNVLTFGYRNDFEREREKIPLSEAEVTVENTFNTQATAVDPRNLDCSAMSTSDSLSQVDQQESMWASQMQIGF